MSKRTIRLIVSLIVAGFTAWSAYHVATPSQADIKDQTASAKQLDPSVQAVRDQLNALEVKGRAPKTGYAREQFGAGWAEVDDCDTRNTILQRDLTSTVLDTDNCKVLSGTLDDPYTAKTIAFTRGTNTSDEVQIDHVVALSNAWQTGAQQLDEADRAQFANDPDNLLAVDGPANNQKSDSDAASWLPPNKSYRCQYVSRQIFVKSKYTLWVTSAEKNALDAVLKTCTTNNVTLS